jgi:hypothetical protein
MRARGAMAFAFLSLIGASAGAEGEVRAFFLEALRAFSPSGYAILNGLETAPATVRYGSYARSYDHGDLYVYAKGSTRFEWAMATNTVVHEANHAYAFSMAVAMRPELLAKGDAYYALYLDGETVLVKRQSVFPSAEIAERIPARLRSRRYDYVAMRRAADSTQKYGVYGLLDEFNSYRLGTQAAYDMLRWYGTRPEQDGAGWAEMYSAIQGTFAAHVEFKYYILEYLRYAREAKPDVFDRIVGDPAFREAFTQVDRLWADLISRYLDTDTNIRIIMSDPAVKVQLWKGMKLPYATITKGGSSQDLLLPCMNEYYEPFMKELEKREYLEIAELLAHY